MKSARVQFIVKFLILIAAITITINIPWVEEHAMQPLTEGITRASAMLLRIGGQRVEVIGTTIRGGAHAVDVKFGCNGIEAVALLVSAVVAFPASWRSRLLAALAGTLLLQSVNLVRVASLFVIARDWPQHFELFHVVIWQTVLFLLSIGYFIWWSARHAAARA